MQLKTILNQLEKQPGFVYTTIRFAQQLGKRVLEIGLRPRAHSRPLCAGCGQRCPGYDTCEPRRYEFVPLWGIKVFFLYARRRANCPTCGIHAEVVPWAQGKHHLTRTFSWFLARWAKRLSWKEVAEAFQTSGSSVFRAVERAVLWGRDHVDLSGIKAVGIDEIQWQRGHHYLTLVYQIDGHCKRLLWIGKDRKVKTLLRFFRWFGKERGKALEFVCRTCGSPICG